MSNEWGRDEAHMRAGRRALIAAMVLNAAAGVGSVLWLARASPIIEDVATRLAFLYLHPWGYPIAWCLWFLAAVSYVNLIRVTGSEAGPRARGLATIGLVLAFAGLLCDACSMSYTCNVVPTLVREASFSWVSGGLMVFVRDPGLLVRIQTHDSALLWGSGVLANGGYSIGLLLVLLAQWNTRGYPRLPIWTGLGVVAAGVFLGVASIWFAPERLVLACACLALAFAAWTLSLVPRYFGKAAAPP